jgi:tryptophan-rich hypothetical protein
MNTNKFNPKKLLNSKWTAVTPVNKQKHFLVTDCILEEETKRVLSFTLEAVMTKNQFELTPEMLENTEEWQQGWQ